MAEEHDTDLILSEADLADSPLIEAAQTRVIIPQKGKLFEDDGTCRVSVIRPCVSRGRKIRGLPPIYTPQMLAENASVFQGWLMYMDHLTEAIEETLRKRGRSIRDLGGRCVETFYDPTVTFKDDDDFGFQPGGVVARALPQPPIRAMIEADPELLHVSINAYPKGARSGVAPWDSSVKGMLIEGIRRRPQGSVDWVPRGGAGGRVLQEAEALAVSVLEAYYDAEHERGGGLKMPKGVADVKTLEELIEAAREENPGLADELAEATAVVRTRRPATPVPAAGLSKAEVEQLLSEQKRELTTDFELKLEEAEEKSDGAVDARLAEARLAAMHETVARGLINAAGLPKTWTGDLLRRYSILPSGPSSALLTEATDEKSAADVLRESVSADIEHARTLITEAGGSPVVEGLGASARRSGGKGKNGGKNTAFRDFLQESHTGGEPLKDEDVKTMIQEGIA